MLTTAAAAAVGLSRHAGATPGRAGALAAGSAGRVRDSRRHAHRRRAGQGCARLRRRLCCPVRQPCPAALRYPRCAGGGARGSWCSRRCVTPNVAPVSLWFAELTCRRSVRYSAAGWPSRRSREPSSTPAWACGRRARCGQLWLRSSNAVVAPPLSSESSWLARLPATAHSAGPPSARWEPVPGRLRSARWASCSAPRNCPHSSRTSMCTTQPGTGWRAAMWCGGSSGPSSRWTVVRTTRIPRRGNEPCSGITCSQPPDGRCCTIRPACCVQTASA